jgi:hypothetical protein
MYAYINYYNIILINLLEFISGVENLNGSEHFSHIQIKGLKSIGKVLEQYDKLISDNLANINVEPLSYNL